jgi:signal transduction histidine kinase
MNSLKKRLIALLIALLSIVGVTAGGISYQLAKQDAGELLDHQLKEVARSIDEGSQLPAMQARFAAENEEERESDFVIQVWVGQEPVRVSRPGFDLPKGSATGFSDTSSQGKKWRTYTIVYPDRTVQVSLSNEVRNEIAADAAFRSVLPFGGLIPLSWVLVAFVVGRILKPLDAVTEAATRRDASSLDPLPVEHVPQEIAPLVREMNALLMRLGEALESQRQFVSNAAHELRTPLAALQLQIDNLSLCSTQADIESRIAELKSGVYRASRLVDQLLKMARFDAAKEPARQGMDLGKLVKSCIAGFIVLAEKKGIDLGMVKDDPAMIEANGASLRILLDNLLDNAIRYSPQGGRIDVSVSVSGKKASVEIADNGPGIPEHLIQHVFERFFRASGQEIEGSGIGLSLVKAIAERESAEIELCNRADGTGLIAKVSFDIQEA